MQSGRIARSAPKFAGTQLGKLYGIRCPRPPTLAIPTDAAETAAATPHRVALHGIQASVAWAVTCVLVHRAAYGSTLKHLGGF